MEDLQRVDIIVYPDAECESIHSQTGPTSRIYHVCAGVPEGGKGQCNVSIGFKGEIRISIVSFRVILVVPW